MKGLMIQVIAVELSYEHGPHHLINESEPLKKIMKTRNHSRLFLLVLIKKGTFPFFKNYSLTEWSS